MEHEVVFSSEYLLITKRSDGFYIESFMSGMSIEQFNKVMSEHTEIKITNFIAIKNCLLFAPSKPEKFGEVKDRVIVEVSHDELRAYVTLCMPEWEFEGGNKNAVLKEIIKALNDNGVTFGIKNEDILNNVTNFTQILAAEGFPPVNGIDSEIKMYELNEAKPEIKDDGNVDHYELNLINKVKAGQWLGERTDPTRGTPGMSVRGNAIQPISGKLLPLMYDKNSVKEEHENGVTTLHSIKAGAVSYEGDRITVSNHLEIEENIDFKTGNIDFEGFLTVKGSIEDNFMVKAKEDIEILGDFGVGSVKEIISHEGSVYIKGGIAGKNKATIRSKKDIYTKYVSDATIICEGRVHIGFYCLNSNIIAKEVILDSPKGQIMGGNIQAEVKVVASIIGSPSEKKTYISVKGFDREQMKEKLEKLVKDSELLKVNVNRLKQEISAFSAAASQDEADNLKREQIREKYFKLKDALKVLEDEKRNMVNYLKTHGEGEVAILKKAFPGTVIEIKKNIRELSKIVLSTTFYVSGRDIKSI